MIEKFKGDMYSDIPVQVKEVHLAKVREYVEGLWEKPSLDQLFIEMTINCNEHCRHCGSRCGDLKMQDQLTDEEIVNFLKNLKAKLKEDGNLEAVKVYGKGKLKDAMETPIKVSAVITDVKEI